MIVKHPYVKGENMLITGGQALLILILATGLIALAGSAGGYDLMSLRLLSLEIFCLAGIFLINGKLDWGATRIFYLLYLLWLLTGLLYTAVPGYGVRVLLKYSYPFLIMLFASKVMDDEDLVIKIALLVRKIGLIVVFLTLVIPFVLVLFPGVLWYRTALAMNFIFMMVLSLAIYDLRRNKWDLIIAFVFFIPCLLWLFRTSILGTLVALTVFSLIRFKLGTLSYLLVLITIILTLFLHSPTFNEKMFKNNISTEQVIRNRGKGITRDDIDSNGRFAMWEWSLNHYYKNNKLKGSGTGTLQSVFYQRNKEKGTPAIVHNDYIQILCDSGLIGLVLYLSVFFSFFVHTFVVYNNKSNSNAIRLCAITAGASVIGLAVTSYTDNTINYSMATFSYPFGFYGMMLGLLRIQKQNYFEET